MQQYEDLLIDTLLDQGFSLDEAERLIALQEVIADERREANELKNLFRWRPESE